MTPDALRDAIASARLRPRMYAQTGEHLASMLYGMVAGAAPDGVDVGPAWGDAYSPANVHAPTDAEVCDAAEATVAALWPQGDAPADECAAFSDVPLDTPMPPAFVAALASLSPAEAGALDLDAIEARANAATMWRPDECELRDEDGEPWAPQGATLGETLITLGDTYDGSASDWCFVAHARTDVPALVARVRELEVQVAAAQPAVARDALRNGRFTAHCCVCSAEWPLGVRDCPGCGHPDRAAGAVPAVSQPAPLDFHGALAAVRNGRFVPTWVRCLACGGTRADVDGAPCEPCRGTGLQPPPSDTDLCPRCGAFDLDHDHACAKSAATVAGEAFATEHPYAAAGIMGSATAREGKG